MRKIFGPKRDKAPRDCRKLHNAELHDFCSSPRTVWVTKSRRMRQTGLVVRTVENRSACRLLIKKPEGKRPFENISVDGRIILKRIFNNKWNGELGLDLLQSR
jgi:hypothetical protein